MQNKKIDHFPFYYYTFVAKSGIPLPRQWLAYSVEHDCVFCLPCWLVPQKDVAPDQDRWGTQVIRDWKHLSEHIKRHQDAKVHGDACKDYET